MKPLIPATASELAASPDFKLELTTETGIKCYVRELSPEVARSIKQDNPDRPFLVEGKPSYLAACVYKGRILNASGELAGLTDDQRMEIRAWLLMMHMGIRVK